MEWTELKKTIKCAFNNFGIVILSAKLVLQGDESNVTMNFMYLVALILFINRNNKHD